MITVLTILAVAAIIFAAWSITVTLSWALIRGAEMMTRTTRTHYRSDGPVVIDPEIRETVHVRTK